MTDDHPDRDSIRGLITALEIFAKYTAKGMDQNFLFSAEHEVIYVALTGEHLPAECDDGKKLQELGFFLDDNHGYWMRYT